MNKIRLAVIFGGQSPEHEVSLSSVNSVLAALDKNKYSILPIAITKSGKWLAGSKAYSYLKITKDNAGKQGSVCLEKEGELVPLSHDLQIDNYLYTDKPIKKIDVALPIIHGSFGEDGRLQGMLDIFGIPYVFSDVLASALAMNKPKCKAVVSRAGVPVLEDKIYTRKDILKKQEIISKFGLPVVIKPTEAGSSVGISIAKTEKELEIGLKKAFEIANEVMFEKYVQGREFTVSVMGKTSPKALAVIEIKPLISDFYNFKAKYEPGGSEHICPADIPEEVAQELKNEAIKAFKAIGCKDLARADFIWDEDNNQIYFIELNTIPGMTSTSLAPEAAKYAGMEFGNFLDKLIGYNL